MQKLKNKKRSQPKTSITPTALANRYPEEDQAANESSHNDDENGLSFQSAATKYKTLVMKPMNTNNKNSRK